MAMKIEEVDLVALCRMVTCQSDVRAVQIVERNFLKALNYLLLPDTLVFWLESVIKFWDDFMESKSHSLPLFFKT